MGKGMKILKITVLTVIVGLFVATIVLLYDMRAQDNYLANDKQTLAALNYAVGQYNAFESETLLNEANSDVSQILTLLEDAGYINTHPTFETRNASLLWDDTNQVFRLLVNNEVQPLSIYGDTFADIAPNLTALINQRYLVTGSYGRTFGQGRFLDIGLQPDDWQYPVLHIYYLPSGSQLQIYLEEGYIADFDYFTGETASRVFTQNTPLIYNDLDGFWYDISITPGQRINVDTLSIRWQ